MTDHPYSERLKQELTDNPPIPGERIPLILAGTAHAFLLLEIVERLDALEQLRTTTRFLPIDNTPETEDEGAW